MNWLCFCRYHIFTVRNEVAKVVFLHVSVCPRGGLPLGILGCHPPSGADPPPVSWSRPPLGADPPAGAGTPPKKTATVADGTHPTGMHSCY